MPNPWVGKSLVVPRTFTAGQERLWPNCSPACGSAVGLTSMLPRSAAPRAPVPQGSPQLTRASTGDTQTQVLLSLLWGPGAHKILCISEPSEHLWQVWGLILNAILPLLPSCWEFLLCPWMRGISLVGSNILLLMVFQRLVAILEFSQEKMSTCPSTLPS